MKRIAVIGGGPAGFFAAIHAAEHSGVALYEKEGSPGKKLLISGSGQCNITHRGEAASFLGRYGSAGRFLRPALYHLTPQMLLAFFEQRGIRFETEEGGKIFPASRRARDILDTLIAAAESRKVMLKPRTAVEHVTGTSGGFLLHTPVGQEGPFERLILAAGGASYPTTGSDGSGFRLAEALGHTVIPPRPALTDTRIAGFALGTHAGASVRDCTVALIRAGKILQRSEGDMLITHRGFSGPVILDMSRNIEAGDELVPDFGGLGEAADERIREFAAENGKKQIKSLSCLLACSEGLFCSLLVHAGVDASQQLSGMSRDTRKKVVRALSGTAYPAAGTGDFRTAMVTAGGVSRKEINPGTMESRLVPGLFFAGEVMDIDGDSGGFNLQAAFSTGALAGDSAG